MDTLNDGEIKKFLETARLYEKVEFHLPSINRANMHIHQIDGTCQKCGQVRPFKTMVSNDAFANAISGRALSTGYTNFEFQCVTCGVDKLLYTVVHTVVERNIIAEKVGEYPRKKLIRDVELQKFLSKDAEYYEKAVVCLAQGYGIGAFSYFRRIVENHIDDLLEMLKEELCVSDSHSDLKSNLEMLQAHTPMSNKIEIANNALPGYLVPNGLNPLGRLYAVLSEGVHNHSDTVCLEKAYEIEACLKYLIAELSSRKKHRNSFASIVGKIS